MFMRCYVYEVITIRVRVRVMDTNIDQKRVIFNFICMKECEEAADVNKMKYGRQ